MFLSLGGCSGEDLEVCFLILMMDKGLNRRSLRVWVRVVG